MIRMCTMDDRLYISYDQLSDDAIQKNFFKKILIVSKGKGKRMIEVRLNLEWIMQNYIRIVYWLKRLDRPFLKR